MKKREVVHVYFMYDSKRNIIHKIYSGPKFLAMKELGGSEHSKLALMSRITYRKDARMGFADFGHGLIQINIRNLGRSD